MTTIAEAIAAQGVRARRAFGQPATELEALIVEQARDMRYRYSIFPDSDKHAQSLSALNEETELFAQSAWDDPTFEEACGG